MRFALTDDQAAFRDAARDLLANECGPEVVRGAWEAPPGRLDRAVWKSLEAMGVLSMLVPESEGGLALDEVWLVPVLEETGYAAIPAPVVETAMVAAPLGVVGMVTTDLGGPLVPWAADADVLLLQDGDTLVTVNPADVELTPADTVDRARRASHISRSGGKIVPLRSKTAARTARLRGELGTAAQLVGLGRRMLDMTVAHVTQREQFGVPVGSFQAVKHHLADALLHLEFARPAVHRAAWSLATDAPSAARDVSMAKAMASDAASLAGRKALQCHGAIGYTVEYDLHLYLKRTWALARAWGDAAWHRRRIAGALGLGRTTG